MRHLIFRVLKKGLTIIVTTTQIKCEGREVLEPGIPQGISEDVGIIPRFPTLLSALEGLEGSRMRFRA